MIRIIRILDEGQGTRDLVFTLVAEDLEATWNKRLQDVKTLRF